MPDGFNPSYLNNTDSTLVNFGKASFKGYAMFVKSNGNITFACTTNGVKGVYNSGSNDYVAGTYQENGRYGTFYNYDANGNYSSNSVLGVNMQKTTYRYIFTTIPINTSNIQMLKNSETENIIYSPFSVTSSFDDVLVDNVENKAFRLDYNQPFTLIGHVGDIPSGTHFINITFSQVGGGLLLRDTLNMYNMFNSSEDFYIDENFDIYIRNRLLTYNIKYLLTCDAFTDSTLTTQTGNYELNYYTITPNAVITGGVITSFGSGDYNTQNSTNDLINSFNNYSSPSGDFAMFFNSSGNLLSGDVISGLVAPEIDGLNNNDIFDLLKALAGTLTYSGDAYFDFSLHGETPTRIYASQFKTPNGPLKIFVSSSLVFFTFYFIVLQIRHVLEMLATADFKNGLNYVDASLDNMFYM